MPLMNRPPEVFVRKLVYCLPTQVLQRYGGSGLYTVLNLARLMLKNDIAVCLGHNINSPERASPFLLKDCKGGLASAWIGYSREDYGLHQKCVVVLYMLLVANHLGVKTFLTAKVWHNCDFTQDSACHYARKMWHATNSISSTKRQRNSPVTRYWRHIELVFIWYLIALPGMTCTHFLALIWWQADSWHFVQRWDGFCTYNSQ